MHRSARPRNCLKFGELLVAVALVAGSLATAHPASAATITTAQAPNILLLISDDQSWSNFTRSLMPNTFAQLVDQVTKPHQRSPA